MDARDIRWKQRFENFQRAFLKLKEAIEKPGLNELERDGLIQQFEFTIDLGWKVLKDYLEEKGFAFKPSPKDSIREAQRAGFIDYGQDLIDGLQMRNELSHDFSGEKFEKYEKDLRTRTFPALTKLYHFLNGEVASGPETI